MGRSAPWPWPSVYGTDPLHDCPMKERDKGPRIRRVPVGDNRPRLVCPDCEYVAYENPKVVVGVVATWEDKLLMCKRAIEPRSGYWTLPAGFMEMGESPQEGAAREAWEEAYAELEDHQSPFRVQPQSHQPASALLPGAPPLAGRQRRA